MSVVYARDLECASPGHDVPARLDDALPLPAERDRKRGQRELNEFRRWEATTPASRAVAMMLRRQAVERAPRRERLVNGLAARAFVLLVLQVSIPGEHASTTCSCAHENGHTRLLPHALAISPRPRRHVSTSIRVYSPVRSCPPCADDPPRRDVRGTLISTATRSAAAPRRTSHPGPPSSLRWGREGGVCGSRSRAEPEGGEPAGQHERRGSGLVPRSGTYVPRRATRPVHAGPHVLRTSGLSWSQPPLRRWTSGTLSSHLGERIRRRRRQHGSTEGPTSDETGEAFRGERRAP